MRGYDFAGAACRNARSCNGSGAEFATAACRPWAGQGPTLCDASYHTAVVACWKAARVGTTRTAEEEVTWMAPMLRRLTNVESWPTAT